MKEAKKKNIIKQLDGLYATRLSTLGTNENFSIMINNLQGQLHQIEGTINRMIKENWESLKIKRRG